MLVTGRNWLWSDLWHRSPLPANPFEPDRIGLFLVAAICLAGIPKSDPFSERGLMDRSQMMINKRSMIFWNSMRLCLRVEAFCFCAIDSRVSRSVCKCSRALFTGIPLLRCPGLTAHQTASRLQERKVQPLGPRVKESAIDAQIRQGLPEIAGYQNSHCALTRI